MTVLISLLVFGIMIGVHEAGHLVAAKMSGVQVHEFAIGMGPKIWAWKGKETQYTLRLLPIGGYCNLEGENGGSESKRAFCNAKAWRKLLILASGALMNLILGYVVLMCFYAGQPMVVEPVVATVLENTPAEEVGLQPGDRIVKMNRTNIHFYPDLSYFMLKNGDAAMDLTVERNGKTLILKDFKPYTESGRSYIGFQPAAEQNNFGKTLKYSYHMGVFMGRMVLEGLWQLISGTASIQDASGPLGIVNEIGNAAKTGWSDLLYIVALITINLGLFNLLPIPALDGGRILFVLISVILRRKIPEKVEGAFHAVGMLLLLLVMLLVTCNDVGRIFG